MRVIFEYRSAAGRLCFPLEVDARCPVNAIMEDAHALAASRGIGPDGFVTLMIEQDQRFRRLTSIQEVIAPLVKRARR